MEATCLGSRLHKMVEGERDAMPQYGGEEKAVTRRLPQETEQKRELAAHLE